MAKILKKSYSISVKPHPKDSKRQELTIMPRCIYKKVGYTDDLVIHLIWYTNVADSKIWDFDHLIITSLNVAILTEHALIAEIVFMDESDMQPQDFESRLKSLGFHREQ